MEADLVGDSISRRLFQNPAMSSTKYDFSGKVALITGSSSGIGEAIAKQLAQYGAKVTITGRNAEALARVASEIEKLFKHKPLQVIGNLVDDFELPTKLINETVNKYGQLDILVNNAGGGNPNDSLFNEKVMQCYEEVMQLNVRSVLELTRLAVPHLEKTKGNIVNISSVASLVPWAPVYCMSKAALDMLTKTAAQELGPKGIRVNSVNPGAVITNIYRSMGMEPSEETKAKMTEQLRKFNVMDMVAQPVEIANLVSFLASCDAANITGAIMVSDTGMLVRNAA